MSGINATSDVKDRVQSLAIESFIDAKCGFGYHKHAGTEDEFTWFIGYVGDDIWHLTWDNMVINDWTEFLPSEDLALARLEHLKGVVDAGEMVQDLDEWVKAHEAHKASAEMEGVIMVVNTLVDDIDEALKALPADWALAAADQLATYIGEWEA